MKRWLSVSCLSAFALVAGSSRADCVQAADESGTSECVYEVRHHEAGAWMALPLVDAMSAAYAAAPDIAKMLEQFRQLATDRKAEAELYWQALQAQKAATTKVEAALSASVQREASTAKTLTEERAAERSVFRSPLFLVGVGSGSVAVGALAGGLATNSPGGAVAGGGAGAVITAAVAAIAEAFR